MKKRFFTLMLCIVLVLASGIACANADSNIYTSLGTVSAGSYIDCLILGCGEAQADWDSAQLPEGCWIEAEYSGESKNLYLRGTCYWAGTYNFTVRLFYDVDSTTYVNCSINIVPADVSFSYIADVETHVGSGVTLNSGASTADYGSYRLQWYRYQDGVEYVLDGQTGSSLYIDCQSVGTYYYFCRGVNMNNGLERVHDSRIVTVRVSDPVVSSISIETMPQKLEYVVGDNLDYSGLALLVQYNTGDIQYVTSGFSVYPLNLTESGSLNITVSYMGQTCSYPVNVKKVEETITGIGINSFPQKTTYTVGETLNTYGMVVRVYSTAKNYDISSGFTCSPVNFTSAGTQTITVSYKGFTCTFTVSVQAPAAEVISVSVLPKKLSYTVGEKLDTTGLVIAIIQGQQRREIITGFSCTPEVLNREGSQEITVNYNGKTCTFYVTVLPDTSSTAVVTPSPAPQGGQSNGGGQSGQGGQSVQNNQNGQSGSAANAQGSTNNRPSTTHKESSSGSSLLVVILVVAITALVGLCVYVYIMQHENVLDFLENLFNRDRD